MRKQSKIALGLLCAAAGCLAVLTAVNAKDAEPKKEPPKPEAAVPVKAKPLSETVKRGLAYLVNQQQANGGWGQGGGWRTNTQSGGRVEGKDVADPPDVASTCMAVLALMRAGNTPKEGPYARNVARGVDFILTNVEKADKTSLYVTDIRDTQVQVKIGPYVDTFLSTMVMAELKGKMADAKGEERLAAAMSKVIAKIEKNQQKDGGFAGNTGWASVLSQGLASKGINRAVQMGFNVQPETLARDNQQLAEGLDKKTGKFISADSIAASKPAASRAGASGDLKTAPAASPAAPSDAGVPIYNTSARVAGLQETVNSLKAKEKELREVLNQKDAPAAAKKQAKEQLELLAKAEETNMAAVRGVVAQVDDPNFMKGFGTNGGEEYLSFMNISETLVVKGGKDWEKWDKAVTENLNRLQDKDGGWSGQHCITGRTFCTAGALLTLMADRAPIPAAAKVNDKK